MQELIVREQHTSGMPLHKFILLVEDNEMLASLLVAAINRQTTYLIDHVVDGQSALDIVVHIEPDLLVLDYQLPDIDGLELYERIHDRRYDASIPTIFANSNVPASAPGNMKTFHLDKPFSVQQFLDAVHTLLDPYL